jgi:RND superfamily putative drug exporter
MGLGAAMTVSVAVIAAVTLLPAVLSLLGHRIDSGKVPFVKQRDDSEAARETMLMARLARTVTRHPWWIGGTATLVLVVLALPVLNIRLGSSDAGSNPSGSTTRKAYDLLTEGFGAGFNGPLLVAVDQSSDPGAAASLVPALRSTPGVASVQAPVTNETGDTAIVTVIPTTSPQAEETTNLVDRLRSDTVPGVLAGTGATAYVGGQTAAFEDIAARLSSRLPLFLASVIGIIFVLMATSFRSIVVAAKAAITTLLSAAAAFGVLVAVFQEGWGAGLLGLDSTGPIEAFLPAIVFAIIFGLATDYEVFLMSRIREE